MLSSQSLIDPKILFTHTQCKSERLDTQYWTLNSAWFLAYSPIDLGLPQPYLTLYCLSNYSAFNFDHVNVISTIMYKNSNFLNTDPNITLYYFPF